MKNQMRILAAVLVLFLSNVLAFTQCTVIPFSLEKRVKMADIVVEGKVLQKESFWNKTHDFIYTRNLIQVTQVFKGQTTEFIEVVTEGGFVGTDGLRVEPSLQVVENEQGVFLLKASTLPEHQGVKSVYQPVASVQSFVKYDLVNRTGHGYFEIYEDVENQLFKKIELYVGKARNTTGKPLLGIQSLRPLAAPDITSIDRDTVAAGIAEVLTIKGSNFGFIKNNGYVEFLDPNYGDGRFYPLYYPSSYLKWSNSEIQVMIPQRAGTGKIRVVNNSGETGTSGQSIYVKYAQSNFGFRGNSSLDSGFFQPGHINLSGNGGYRWTMATNFEKNQNAVNAFFRAAETWRCNTRMNWDVSSTTTTPKGFAPDGINVVEFTKFGDGRLGVCSSWYSGCIGSNIGYFYVSELDIMFDSTISWYYGQDKPQTSQYDFETVATHELGHGHQLNHVIDDSKIMHYSLRNGERKTTLHKHDLEGAAYVRDTSEQISICGKGKYKAINVADCNITKPEADFTVNITSPCPGTNVRFTDNTKGKVNQYRWFFGNDASADSATTVGPHVVSYSTGGDKDIRLIVSNDFGVDTMDYVLTVQPDVPDTPGVVIQLDTACANFGSYTYTIMGVMDATSYSWTASSAGSLVGSIVDTSVVITWNQAGTHQVSVSAKNNCGTSAPRTMDVVVIDTARAAFNPIANGMQFDFENTSVNATAYFWAFGDGDTSIEEEPSHTYQTRNTYTVSLVASNVCSSNEISQEVDAQFRLSIDPTSSNRISIAPNPSDGRITLMLDQWPATIQLVNDVGQVVFKKELTGPEEIDLRHLQKGLYLYEVTNGDAINTGRLILVE